MPSLNSNISTEIYLVFTIHLNHLYILLYFYSNYKNKLFNYIIVNLFPISLCDSYCNIMFAMLNYKKKLTIGKLIEVLCTHNLLGLRPLFFFGQRVKASLFRLFY